MTAINVVVQRKFGCAHVVTDGAHYFSDGMVQGIAPKTFPVPSWPGAVATRGPSFAPMVIGQMLALRFQSFDDVVAGISDALPDMIDRMFLDEYDSSSKTVELLLVGYSAERDRPESYFLRTSNELPFGVTDESAAEIQSREKTVFGEAFELIELPAVAVAPIVEQQTMQMTGYEGIGVDEDVKAVLFDLRTCLEVQRHTPIAGLNLVGGIGHLLTVDKNGITMRELCRWDDQIGEMIEPKPIDWKSWIAGRKAGEADAALASIDMKGMSRMKREMLERKARKGKLTVVP